MMWWIDNDTLGVNYFGIFMTKRFGKHGFFLKALLFALYHINISTNLDASSENKELASGT